MLVLLLTLLPWLRITEACVERKGKVTANLVLWTVRCDLWGFTDLLSSDYGGLVKGYNFPLQLGRAGEMAGGVSSDVILLQSRYNGSAASDLMD